MQMQMEDAHVRRQVKTEPERTTVRFSLVPFLIQSFHGFLPESHQPLENGRILDIKGSLDMFFGAGQDMSPRGGKAEIVKGKALVVLGDNQVVGLFLLEDLAKLAVLIMIRHKIYLC